MKHCLITGGAGFIGSHLAETLLERGARVSVVDDESTGSIDNLAAVAEHPEFLYTKGSVADRELVRRLVAEVDEGKRRQMTEEESALFGIEKLNVPRS